MRTYFVTAEVQLVCDEENEFAAVIQVKDRLNDLIASSDFPNDPSNGAVINTVDDVTYEEELESLYDEV